MARELLRDSPDDIWLRKTVTNIEESIRARDPLHGLTAEGRARVRSRLEVFISRIRARRRSAPGYAAPGALIPAAAEELGITLPAVSPEPPVEEDLPLVLEEVTSGIVSPGVAYAAVETSPAAAAEEAPRPTPPHEIRSRKLRLLEALMDRVERRRRSAAR